MSETALGEIKAAFLTHHVLAIRNQNLTVEQQIAFGRHFGELDSHPFVVGTPQPLRVRAEARTGVYQRTIRSILTAPAVTPQTLPCRVIAGGGKDSSGPFGT